MKTEVSRVFHSIAQNEGGKIFLLNQLLKRPEIKWGKLEPKFVVALHKFDFVNKYAILVNRFSDFSQMQVSYVAIFALLQGSLRIMNAANHSSVAKGIHVCNGAKTFHISISDMVRTTFTFPQYVSICNVVLFQILM